MPTIRLLFLAVVMLGCVLRWPGVTAAPPLPYEVVLVQVVHRHGARSPTADYNESAICGWDFPCGHLNIAGRKMMENVGWFLHERYTNTHNSTVVVEPFFPDDGFNASVAYVRSTDVPRTLQSAEAFLRGLFPDMEKLYPVIHTVDAASDILLNSEASPAVRARKQYGTADERAACNSVVDANFALSTLQEIASEVYSEGYCADNKTRMRCATRLCDIAQSYRSTGELPAYPLLSQHRAALCAVTACRSAFRYQYSCKDEARARQGSAAQPLARELITNMNNWLTGESPVVFYEYSTHDSTLTPFASLLGDNSEEAMAPPFGTTYVVELVFHGTSPFVRILRGSPGATPESQYEFAFTPFNLQCMDANYSVYTAIDNACLLTDFVRFVNSSMPTSSAGQCYLDPAYALLMDCPRDARRDTRPLSKDCALFRKQCPTFACEHGYHLDWVDYGCYTKRGWRTLWWRYLVFALVSGAVGGVLTLAGLAYVVRRLRSPEEATYTVVATSEEAAPQL